MSRNLTFFYFPSNIESILLTFEGQYAILVFEGRGVE